MGGDWSGGGFYEESTLLASGLAQNVGGLLQLPVFDMRNFQSYYLHQNAITTGAASYNSIRANLRWSSHDETDPNNAFQVYREDYEFWAQTPAQGANIEGVSQGIDYQQDQIHGNKLSLSWSNFGATAVAMDYALYGSSRPFDRAYHFQSAYDDFMYVNSAVALPAGNQYYHIPLPRYTGRAFIHLDANSAVQVSLSFGSIFGQIFLLNGAGSTTLNQEVVLPNYGALLRLNRPAGAGTAAVFVTTQRTRT